jgi:hypothetical protein
MKIKLTMNDGDTWEFDVSYQVGVAVKVLLEANALEGVYTWYPLPADYKPEAEASKTLDQVRDPDECAGISELMLPLGYQERKPGDIQQ